MKKILFPISADPLTNGHLDLIHRSIEIADKVVIAILKNKSKKSMFELQERKEIVEKVIEENPILRKAKKEKKICVICYEGLLVNLATEIETHFVIRGLRDSNDWNYEKYLEESYRNQLWKKEQRLEFIYLRSNSRNSNVSSSFVKNVFSHYGDISHFVPLLIKQKMEKKIFQQKKIIITGSIASGKTTCAKALAKVLGKYEPCWHIDFDEIVAKIYKEIENNHYPILKKNIKNIFPETLQKEKINKKMIVEYINKNSIEESKKILEKLQNLLMPNIRWQYAQRLKENEQSEEQKKGFILLDMPMAGEYNALGEANNLVIFTETTKKKQIQRLLQRCDATVKEAEKRIVLAGTNEEKKTLIEKKIAFYNHGRCFFLNTNEQDNTEKIQKLASELRQYFEKI